MASSPQFLLTSASCIGKRPGLDFKKLHPKYLLRNAKERLTSHVWSAYPTGSRVADRPVPISGRAGVGRPRCWHQYLRSLQL